MSFRGIAGAGRWKISICSERSICAHRYWKQDSGEGDLLIPRDINGASYTIKGGQTVEIDCPLDWMPSVDSVMKVVSIN